MARHTGKKRLRTLRRRRGGRSQPSLLLLLLCLQSRRLFLPRSSPSQLCLRFLLFSRQGFCLRCRRRRRRRSPPSGGLLGLLLGQGLAQSPRVCLGFSPRACQTKTTKRFNLETKTTKLHMYVLSIASISVENKNTKWNFNFVRQSQKSREHVRHQCQQTWNIETQQKKPSQTPHSNISRHHGRAKKKKNRQPNEHAPQIKRERQRKSLGQKKSISKFYF